MKRSIDLGTITVTRKRSEPMINNIPVSQVTSAGVNPKYDPLVYKPSSPTPTVPPPGVFTKISDFIRQGADAFTSVNNAINSARKSVKDTYQVTVPPQQISVLTLPPGTQQTNTDKPIFPSNTIFLGGAPADATPGPIFMGGPGFDNQNITMIILAIGAFFLFSTLSRAKA